MTVAFLIRDLGVTTPDESTINEIRILAKKSWENYNKGGIDKVSSLLFIFPNWVSQIAKSKVLPISVGSL